MPRKPRTMVPPKKQKRVVIPKRKAARRTVRRAKVVAGAVAPVTPAQMIAVSPTSGRCRRIEPAIQTSGEYSRTTVAASWAHKSAVAYGVRCSVLLTRRPPGRGRRTDIDLVVMDDRAVNHWQRHAIARDLNGILGYVQIKAGEKIESFTHPTRCGLDLYYATPDTWGITLLVRTGSASHNIFLAEHGRKQLPSRRLSVARGILNTADTVVASHTEADCFSALGLRYIPPEEREAPEFDARARGEDPA